MRTNLSVIGDIPLNQVCIPASHDAGMWLKSGGTKIGGTENNILTQTQSIYQQLQYGARIFDIRPTFSRGKWVCGHYTKIDWIGWQGGDGASIEEVIADVNRFTNENRELVILDISHTYNMEAERSCNDEERAQLLGLFSHLNYIYHPSNPQDVHLENVLLNEYIGQDKCSVIVAFANDENFTAIDLSQRDFYAKGTQLSLKDRGLCRMQSDEEAVRSTLGNPFCSVLSLARVHVEKEFPLVLQAMVNDYPSTITTDNIHNVDAITLSLAVTHLRHNLRKGNVEPIIVYGGRVIESRDIRALVMAAIQKREDYVVSNETLGGDPLVGVFKSCAVYYHENGLIKGRFAWEGQALPFSRDIHMIVYGGVEIRDQAVYNVFFNAMSTSSGLLINNATLGGDPAPNVFKTCTVFWRTNSVTSREQTVKEWELILW